MEKESFSSQKISVKVIPNAKQVLVKEEEGLLKVYTSAKAVDGKANQSVIEILAKYFHVKKRQVEITRGLKSRNKSITIYKL